MKPKLLIVLASTRPGRVGLPVATWFTEHLRSPMVASRWSSSISPSSPCRCSTSPPTRVLREYTHDHTLAWSAIVDAADAVVLVTAEYNYGYPAALKNALDYLHHEWRYKPVGFVSYGGVAAGTRAVQQLKQVTGALQLFSTQTAVNIPFVFAMIEDAVMHANDVMVQAGSAMLGELETLNGALAPLRSKA